MKITPFTIDEIKLHNNSMLSSPKNNVSELKSFEDILDKLSDSDNLLEYTQEELINYYKIFEINDKIPSLNSFFKDEENRNLINQKLKEFTNYIKNNYLILYKNKKVNNIKINIDNEINLLLENHFSNTKSFADNIFELGEEHGKVRIFLNEYLKYNLIKEFFISEYELEDNDSIKNSSKISELNEDEITKRNNGKQIIKKINDGNDRKSSYLRYMSSKRFLTFIERYFNGNLPNDFYGDNLNFESGTQKSIVGITLALSKKFPKELKRVTTLYLDSFKTLLGDDLSNKNWNEKNYNVILNELRIVIRNFVVLKINEYSKKYSDKETSIERIKEEVDTLLETFSTIIEVKDKEDLLPDFLDDFLSKKTKRNKQNFIKDNDEYLQSIIDGHGEKPKILKISLDKIKRTSLYSKGLFESVLSKFKSYKTNYKSIEIKYNENQLTEISEELKNSIKNQLVKNNKENENFDLEESYNDIKNSLESIGTKHYYLQIVGFIDNLDKNIELKRLLNSYLNINTKFILYENIYEILGKQSYETHKSFSLNDLKNIAKKEGITDINFEILEKKLDTNIHKYFSDKIFTEKNLELYKSKKYSNLSKDEYEALGENEKMFYNIIEEVYHKENIKKR